MIPGPLTALVRRADPDRFFTALFAPAVHRPALLALYAFNHETARAREIASQPMLGLIRLQWWREVVEGERKPHEVATPLAEALDGGALHAPDLLAILDARELDSLPDVTAWRAWLAAGAGGVAVAAARALGMTDPERARAHGALYGGAGVLRSVPFAAARGRCLLPHDVLRAHGLDPEDVLRDPASAAPAIVTLRDALRAEAPPARHWPRQTIAAALPAAFARRDLRRAGARTGTDRLAVLAAYAASRV